MLKEREDKQSYTDETGRLNYRITRASIDGMQNNYYKVTKVVAEIKNQVCTITHSSSKVFREYSVAMANYLNNSIEE